MLFANRRAFCSVCRVSIHETQKFSQQSVLQFGESELRTMSKQFVLSCFSRAASLRLIGPALFWRAELSLPLYLCRRFQIVPRQHILKLVLSFVFFVLSYLPLAIDYGQQAI